MSQKDLDKEMVASSYVDEDLEQRVNKETVIAQIDASASNAVTAAEKQLLRKIDWRVLPIPILLIGLSSIDRTNIASARVAGMETDLDLYGNRYNIAASGRWLL